MFYAVSSDWTHCQHVLTCSDWSLCYPFEKDAFFSILIIFNCFFQDSETFSLDSSLFISKYDLICYAPVFFFLILGSIIWKMKIYHRLLGLQNPAGCRLNPGENCLGVGQRQADYPPVHSGLESRCPGFQGFKHKSPPVCKHPLRDQIFAVSLLTHRHCRPSGPSRWGRTCRGKTGWSRSDRIRKKCTCVTWAS